MDWHEYTTSSPLRYVGHEDPDVAQLWFAHLHVSDGMRVPQLMAAIEVHPALTGEYLPDDDGLHVAFGAPTDVDARITTDLIDDLAAPVAAHTHTHTTPAGDWSEVI